MHHCLKAPSGNVLGLRLDAETLGPAFYDVLDWADEHFPGYFVEQTDGRVYVCSEALGDTDAADRESLRTEPLEGLGPVDQNAGSSGNGPVGGDGTQPASV